MPKFDANLTFLFNELPFLDRFAAARKAGFLGVEYMSPYETTKEEIAARLRDNGLTQALFNLPAGDWGKGERGMAVLPDRVDEFKRGVGKAIDYAGALGCKQINCLAGLAPKDAEAAALQKTFVANLAYAASELGKAGIRLLIEPCNTRDMPGFYLNRTEQALRLIDEVGSDNLYVQYDIYHMQNMEGDLARTIEANLKRIAHIQIADNPGRNEPGTGEINYPFLFAHLDKIGYRGWVGCEYRPRATTAEGLGWLSALRAAA
ncbi:MAG TPA: hydroxypyruvate isomerase [Roseiarcus sp.]|nr:hydroxypyruvate isomerase [Roseiarcus sp.]